jgi:hypothetical protein
MASGQLAGRVRAWVRAIHRDAGYLAVGLTLVYALSGLAVNHLADWDPNFRHVDGTFEVGDVARDLDDQAAARAVLRKLAIQEEPKEVYRAAPDALEILFEHRTLHVDTSTGHVEDEGRKPRFFLRVANWLHLNRGKKGWTRFADAYAVGLLLLATSGLFMIPGRKGLFGRGAVLVAIGVAIPLFYVRCSGGP